MAGLEEVRLDCPFCGKADHFYLNTGKLAWTCFGCGKSGYGWREEFSRFGPSIKKFKHRARRGQLLISAVQQVSPSTVTHILPDDYKPLYGFTPTTLNGIAVLRYLWRRGIKAEEIEAYRVGYGLMTAIFPLYYKEDVLLYWVARRISGEPRYVNAPWPRLGALFFSRFTCMLKFGSPLVGTTLESSRIREIMKTRVAVEGVIDAIKLGRLVPTVSALGKEWSDQDFKTLREAGVERLVFALDPDALKQGITLAKRALSWMKYAWVHRVEGGDPAERWQDLGPELYHYWEA